MLLDRFEFFLQNRVVDLLSVDDISHGSSWRRIRGPAIGDPIREGVPQIRKQTLLGRQGNRVESEAIGGTLASIMEEGVSAFILGAGLGTRLRPLTEELPKPLVPVWNRPLIDYAMEHLIGDLAASRFLVNTHHCPEKYDETYPGGDYRGRPLSFRHEPVLLDTAGGLDNIRDWIPADQSIVIYNGDILTDLPLQKAWQRHVESGDLATLILRSEGEELRVGYDANTGRIVDLRGALRPEWKDRFQFTGIYFLSPEFLSFLHPGAIESIVFPLLRAIEKGASIAGVVIDEGIWSDLGERESYLDALAVMRKGIRQATGEQIAGSAQIHATASIDEFSSIGPNAVVGAGCRIEKSAVWANAKVESGVHLREVVVRSGKTAETNLSGIDL